MNSAENNVFSFDVGLNAVPQPEQVNNVVETPNTMDIFNQIQQPLINNVPVESNIFETSVEQPIEQNTIINSEVVPEYQPVVESADQVMSLPTIDLPEMPNVMEQQNEEFVQVGMQQPITNEIDNNLSESVIPVQSEIQVVEPTEISVQEEPKVQNVVESEVVEPQIQHMQQINEMFPTNETAEPSLTPFEPSTLPEPMMENVVSNLPDEDTSKPVVEQVTPEIVVETPSIPERTGVITMSDTTTEELNKITEYQEPEKIETTDIKSLFDRVGINVKEASDIFRKNSEMKEKLDSRFEELKKLQSEVQKSKKVQMSEIDAYKNEVLDKLNSKKEEIEKRLIKLKEFQKSLEKEKENFEAYKKAQKAEIEKVQREVQEAYDARRDELNHIEDILRNQKDALDEERNQLSLDRIQYEADKNELANNLLKFNEIVDSFTNGMDKIGKE